MSNMRASEQAAQRWARAVEPIAEAGRRVIDHVRREKETIHITLTCYVRSRKVLRRVDATVAAYRRDGLGGGDARLRA